MDPPPTQPTTTTSPSEVWRSYQDAIDAVGRVNTSDIGAGQKATIVNGLELDRMSRLWGVPVHPGDPTSMAAASYQQEIDQIDAEIALLKEYGADDNGVLIGNLLFARTIAFGLMREYFSANQVLSTHASLHMRATSADEYEAAELAATIPSPKTSNRIDYAEIKRRLPMREYAERFGPVIDRGRTARAHCPGHDDERPSLIIYPETDSWWCPVCNKGGDIFHYEEMRLGRKAVPET